MTARKPDPLAEQMEEWGLPYEYNTAAQLLAGIPRIDSEYVVVVANVRLGEYGAVRTFGGWWDHREAQARVESLRRRRKVTVLSACSIAGVIR